MEELNHLDLMFSVFILLYIKSVLLLFTITFTIIYKSRHFTLLIFDTTEGFNQY